MTAPVNDSASPPETADSGKAKAGASLDSARAHAEASRTRLRDRLDELRARTKPAALIGEAKDLARARAIDLAASAVNQPRARTVIAAGAIGAGLAYLFRKPLLKALAKRLIPESKHDR